MTVTSDGTAGGRLVGVVRFRRSGMDLSMTSSRLDGGTAMRIVYVGSAVYLDLGTKHEGKTWVRITPGGADPLSQTIGPLLREVGAGLDPRKQLTGSRDSTVTGASRTRLAGVAATRYTLVTSEEALLAQMEEIATSAGMLAEVQKQFKGSHAESVLLIGDDGLPLRIDSRVVGGRTPSATSRITYSHWGEPVTIVAPPRSDVLDYTG